MFTDLGILTNTVAERSEMVQVEDYPEAVYESKTSIRRKLQNVEVPREHEIYTRAWAIYSRARTRRAVHAYSII